MESGCIVPDCDAGLSLQHGRLAHFRHRTPGIWRDVLERRQGLARDRPAEAMRVTALEGPRRHAAAPRDADIIRPYEKNGLAVGHAAQAGFLRRLRGLASSC